MNRRAFFATFAVFAGAFGISQLARNHQIGSAGISCQECHRLRYGTGYWVGHPEKPVAKWPPSCCHYIDELHCHSSRELAAKVKEIGRLTDELQRYAL